MLRSFRSNAKQVQHALAQRAAEFSWTPKPTFEEDSYKPRRIPTKTFFAFLKSVYDPNYFLSIRKLRVELLGLTDRLAYLICRANNLFLNKQDN